MTGAYKRSVIYRLQRGEDPVYLGFDMLDADEQAEFDFASETIDRKRRRNKG